MKIEKLSRLIGHKCCVLREGQQDVLGYLSIAGNGQSYAIWDSGDTLRFDDDDIDFVEINFVHLKPGSYTYR